MASVRHAGWLLIITILTLSTGCARPEEGAFTSSERVSQLSPRLRVHVERELIKEVGTYQRPVLLRSPEVSIDWLLKGQAVYQQRCVQCHGINGDGNGPVASSMYPRPRDYRQGIFKFTSTSYGSKPMREDLIRTVTYGVRGTSMPDFKLIPSDELEAVVDYVIYLSRRGELEDKLAYLMEEFLGDLPDAEITDQVLAEIIAEEDPVGIVVDSWERAASLQVLPLTVQPTLTFQHVLRGREVFLNPQTACFNCHGEDGRGQTRENLLGERKDAWGHITRAADLTSGMLRGGRRPIDIYRRIYAGINGTPMPAHVNAFRDEPEKIWDLVAYVTYLSDRRRMGEAPEPGPLAPYGEAFDYDAWLAALGSRGD